MKIQLHDLQLTDRQLCGRGLIAARNCFIDLQFLQSYVAINV